MLHKGKLSAKGSAMADEINNKSTEFNIKRYEFFKNIKFDELGINKEKFKSIFTVYDEDNDGVLELKNEKGKNEIKALWDDIISFSQNVNRNKDLEQSEIENLLEQKEVNDITARDFSDFIVAIKEYGPGYDEAIEFLDKLVGKANKTVQNRDLEQGAISYAVNFFYELFKSELAESNVKETIKEEGDKLFILENAKEGRVRDKKTKKLMSFEEVFKDQRGVEFNKDNIAKCSELADKCTKMKTLIDMNSHIKGKLNKAILGDVNTRMKQGAGNALFEAFKCIDLSDIKEINKLLKTIEEQNPQIKEYGTNLRINKDKDGKFVVYRTAENGYPAPATNEQLKIIVKVMCQKLDSTLDNEISKIYNGYEKEIKNLQVKDKSKKDNSALGKYEDVYALYLNSFKNAYGKVNVEKLAEAYVMTQQQNVEYVKMGINLLSMALMVVPGGVTAASGLVLKSANTASRVWNAINKSAQVAQKGMQAVSPLIIANMTLSPTQLVEKLTSEKGMSEEEWNEWGEQVLQNVGYMAAGMGASKIAQNIAAMYKTKALVSALNETGKRKNEIIAMVKANPVKFPTEILESFKNIDKVAKTLQVSNEVVLDLISTIALNKMMNNGELLTMDVINSIVFAVMGGYVQKDFAKLKGNKDKIEIILKEFEQFGITREEANNVLKAMDDISAGKVKPEEAIQVKNSEPVVKRERAEVTPKKTVERKSNIHIPFRLKSKLHDRFHETLNAVYYRKISEFQEAGLSHDEMIREFFDTDKFLENNWKEAKKWLTDMEKRMEELDKSFDFVIPALGPETYYRGICEKSDTRTLQVIKNANIGDIIVPDCGYAWGTPQLSYAKDYAQISGRKANPDNSVIMEIKTSAGTTLSRDIYFNLLDGLVAINPYYNVNVVFRRNAQYKVLKKEIKDNITYITLKYMGVGSKQADSNPVAKVEKPSTVSKETNIPKGLTTEEDALIQQAKTENPADVVADKVKQQWMEDGLHTRVEDESVDLFNLDPNAGLKQPAPEVNGEVTSLIFTDKLKDVLTKRYNEMGRVFNDIAKNRSADFKKLAQECGTDKQAFANGVIAILAEEMGMKGLEPKIKLINTEGKADGLADWTTGTIQINEYTSNAKKLVEIISHEFAHMLQYRDVLAQYGEQGLREIIMNDKSIPANQKEATIRKVLNSDYTKNLLDNFNELQHSETGSLNEYITRIYKDEFANPVDPDVDMQGYVDQVTEREAYNLGSERLGNNTQEIDYIEVKEDWTKKKSFTTHKSSNGVEYRIHEDGTIERINSNAPKGVVVPELEPLPKGLTNIVDSIISRFEIGKEDSAYEGLTSEQKVLRAIERSTTMKEAVEDFRGNLKRLSENPKLLELLENKELVKDIRDLKVLLGCGKLIENKYEAFLALTDIKNTEGNSRFSFADIVQILVTETDVMQRIGLAKKLSAIQEDGKYLLEPKEIGELLLADEAFRNVDEVLVFKKQFPNIRGNLGQVAKALAFTQRTDMKDFMLSDYMSKLKQNSAGKYQNELLEVFKPENMTTEFLSKLLQTDLSEADFLNSIKKMSKSTFKLAYETPHQYLSGIDIAHTTLVNGKLPELSAKELSGYRERVIGFFRCNIGDIAKALKYLDTDTVSHMMDKRTSLFLEQIMGLNKLTDENYQLLSELLNLKVAGTNKKVSPKIKMQLCKLFNQQTLILRC